LNTIYDKYDNTVGEDRWLLIDGAIKAFMRRFPYEWVAFVEYMNSNRTEYGLATKENKSLRQANFRRIMEFPEAYDPIKDRTYNLYNVVNKIIPGFTQIPRIKKEFLKRYPAFGGGDKY